MSSVRTMGTGGWLMALTLACACAVSAPGLRPRAVREAIASGDCEKVTLQVMAAARDGYPEAEFLLGEMYRTGCGVRKDEKQAIKYLEFAARNGHEEARLRLTGLGVHPPEAVGFKSDTAGTLGATLGEIGGVLAH